MDNILKYLENTAEKFPDKTAVDDGNQQFTYQELLNRASTFWSVFPEQDRTRQTSGNPARKKLRDFIRYVWRCLCRMFLCNDRSGTAA